MDIYVGNIPYESTEDDIAALFGEHGLVKAVRFIRDYETKRFKGYGFVSMDNQSDATNAIEKLNGTEVNGRELKISSARR